MAKSSPTKLMGAISKLVKKALKEAAKPKVGRHGAKAITKKAPTKLLKPQLMKKVAKTIRKKMIIGGTKTPPTPSINKKLTNPAKRGGYQKVKK